MLPLSALPGLLLLPVMPAGASCEGWAGASIVVTGAAVGMPLPPLAAELAAAGLAVAGRAPGVGVLAALVRVASMLSAELQPAAANTRNALSFADVRDLADMGRERSEPVAAAHLISAATQAQKRDAARSDNAPHLCHRVGR
jgi:hypothetical protein